MGAETKAAWKCEPMSIWLVFSLICIVIGKLMQPRTITGGFSISVQLVITCGRYRHILIRHKHNLFRLWNSLLCWQTNVPNKSEGKDLLVCYPPIGSNTECLTNQLTISKLQHEDRVAEGNRAGVAPQYRTRTPKPAQNRLPRHKYKAAGPTASPPGVICACSKLHL